MMRKCHLNTCPVGVATQDPVLRKKFAGQARARRQLLLLRRRGSAPDHGAAGHPQVRRPDRPRRPARHAQGHRALEGARPGLQPPVRTARACRPTCRASMSRTQDHGLEKALDVHADREVARRRIERGEKVQFIEVARNVNRTVGAMLSGELTKRASARACRTTRIRIQLEGTGGQCFGAFLARGITLYLIGDANDYTGKGLSGGRIVVRPEHRLPRRSDREHHHRQHRAVRRDHRRGLLPRRGRRALRGAPVGRHRGGRRHRRPRLRVHDRRHGRRAGQDRAQLRGRHVRRHRLRLRRGRPVRQRAATPRWCRWTGCCTAPSRRVGSTARSGTASQTDEALLKKLLEDHHRWTGSRAHANCSTTGPTARRSSSRCSRTSTSARSPRSLRAAKVELRQHAATTRTPAA